MIIYNNFYYKRNVEEDNKKIFFSREELNLILRLYGRFVAAGQWRDYGISIFSDVSVFSIYKGYGESPIYTIEKRPKFEKRNGKFSVVGVDGAILKRANDLEVILSFFSRKLMKLYKIT